MQHTRPVASHLTPMKRVARFTQQNSDLMAAGGLFVFALLVYLSTLAPTVVSIYDDSLEFPLVAYRLAIAHPTGYPLYTLLGKAFTLLPVGEAAFRVHLLSALSAAGAVTLIYVAARRFGLHISGALAAALFLAVSPLFWSQAIIAEVYALNALFVAAVLALSAALAPSSLALAPLSFLFGLSLTHHRTMLLLLPAILVYLSVLTWPGWTHMRAGPWRERLLTAGKLLGLFCLPLLLYLYIPLRGMVTSSLDGTYRNTWRDFLAWIGGTSYSVFLKSNPLHEPRLAPADYLDVLRQQFGVAGMALALLGSVWLLWRRWRPCVLLGLAWLMNVAFVYAYRVADAPVFLIPSFMLVALTIGAGVHVLAVASPPSLRHRLPTRRKRHRTSEGSGPSMARARRLAAALVALALPIVGLASNLPRLSLRDNWAVHNYAIDALRQPLESGASLVGILGEMTLFRYFQETQGLRPDVQTVAADTDEQRLAAVNRLMADGRAVYLTRALPAIEHTYSLSALGPLLAARPKESAVSVSQPAARARFGDEIALVGYAVTGLPPASHRPAPFPASPREESEAGGVFRLTLTWQALRQPTTDYRVTVRLFASSGHVLWQRDGSPAHSGYPTSAWRAGEIITDCYDLMVPLGTPPGTYDLRIGLYHPVTLQTLPTTGEGGLHDLGPVSVVRPQSAVNLDSLPLHPPQAAGLAIPNGLPAPSLELLGIQRVLRANLENEIELYGCGLSRTPLVPGQPVDVSLLWRALRPPAGNRVVFVQLLGKDNRLWASHESQPSRGSYSTSEWQRDEIVRDVHTLMLPADMPDGDYRLLAGMYAATGERLTVLRWTRRSLDHVDLGTVQVRGRPHTMVIPPMPFRVNARVGDLARLVGYDLGVGELGRGVTDGQAQARPGDTVNVSLVWQATGMTSTSYTVFVHLLAPDGRVVNQDDAIPGGGTLFTTSWVRGEVLVDEHRLLIPPQAVPGVYDIEVGLYDAATGARLPTWDEGGRATGDRLLLAKVRVDRGP